MTTHLFFLGGTRFIGHAAAARALELGHTVTVAHRGHHPCDLAGANDLTVDRADPAAIRRAIDATQPDVLIDTRAMTQADATTTTAALAGTNLPVVVLSSQDVYAQFGALNGHPAPPPEPLITEDSPLTVPFPFRGLAAHEGGDDYDKKDVERVFLAAPDLPAVTILRLPAVYGPRDPARRFAGMVDVLTAATVTGQATLPRQGGASWRWTHAHVRDVAHGINLAAARRTDRAIFNLGEHFTPTMAERAARVAAHLGVDLTWEDHDRGPLPEPLRHLGCMPHDFVVDTTRARDQLGYTAITTEAERLADLVAR